MRITTLEAAISATNEPKRSNPENQPLPISGGEASEYVKPAPATGQAERVFAEVKPDSVRKRYSAARRQARRLMRTAGDEATRMVIKATISGAGLFAVWAWHHWGSRL
ncbi:hypothetical protein [Streptomyces sp. NPDC088736]|uniref:hypothetical protein n=1 Tax=Streptomyces sp. NPDC088736 TaxID=3365881 RepID=UPI003816B319